MSKHSKAALLSWAAFSALAGCSSALVGAAKEGRTGDVQRLLPGDKAHCGPAVREAAGRGRVQTLAVLLDGGCAVDAKDGNGYTALMLAAMEGQDETVRFLLVRKADPELATWNDKTAAKLARERGHKKTAEMIDRGALIAFAGDAAPPEPSPVHKLLYDLLRCTKAGDSKGRAKAAAGLIKAGPAAVPELTRAAKGEGVVDDLGRGLNGLEGRRIAIKVLGLMGPAAADARSVLFAAQGNPDLRDDAVQALQSVAGRR